MSTELNRGDGIWAVKGCCDIVMLCRNRGCESLQTGTNICSTTEPTKLLSISRQRIPGESSEQVMVIPWGNRSCRTRTSTTLMSKPDRLILGSPLWMVGSCSDPSARGGPDLWAAGLFSHGLRGSIGSIGSATVGAQEETSAIDHRAFVLTGITLIT